MRIALVTPAAQGSATGNRVTAERWRELLAELGHEVTLTTTWNGEPCDLLVAVHARKSFPAIERLRKKRPDVLLVVALAGTDLYVDLPAGDASARAALSLAHRIVVLQPAALAELPVPWREKTRVILQSAAPPERREPTHEECFEVVCLAHLRAVKDPLLAARAVRLLPASSRLLVVHAGAALDPELGLAARAEAAANPRWRYLGELSHDDAMALLTRARLLLVTSKLEGGANVVAEALAANVPVLSTHIAGSVGQLGEGYPGFFPVGDAPALAALLHRAETDAGFLAELATYCRERLSAFSRQAEREDWRRLIAEITTL